MLGFTRPSVTAAVNATVSAAGEAAADKSHIEELQARCHRQQYSSRGGYKLRLTGRSVLVASTVCQAASGGVRCGWVDCLCMCDMLWLTGCVNTRL